MSLQRGQQKNCGFDLHLGQQIDPSNTEVAAACGRSFDSHIDRQIDPSNAEVGAACGVSAARLERIPLAVACGG